MDGLLGVSGLVGERVSERVSEWVSGRVGE